jgi:UDP-2,3-diacylglucosamine pyrophosphatase LpxH
MLDAIIVSDIHLGSSNCQAKMLCTLLQSLHEQTPRAARLILNGDVFDSIDFRRLTKHHWKVLSLLRKLSDTMEIIWIAGNHDGSAEIISHLLGVTVKEEYILASGKQKILILHGHTFDSFIDSHPVLTWIGDLIYLLLQRIDRTHYFAKLAKKGSKTFLRCVKKVEEQATDYARSKGCTAVCCGHTHHSYNRQNGSVHYWNSGCWTEHPCTYLTIAGGRIELHRFVDPEMDLLSFPPVSSAPGVSQELDELESLPSLT